MSYSSYDFPYNIQYSEAITPTPAVGNSDAFYSLSPAPSSSEIRPRERRGPNHISENYCDRYTLVVPPSPKPSYHIMGFDVNIWYPSFCGSEPSVPPHLYQLPAVIDDLEIWTRTLTPNQQSVVAVLRDFAKYSLVSGDTSGDPKWRDADLKSIAFGPDSPISQWCRRPDEEPELSEFVAHNLFN